MTTSNPQSLVLADKHFASLDGFRGFLAVWVYLGHLATAVGFSNYFLNMHALAVDVFMVLSGFLMVYTWKKSLEDSKILDAQAVQSFYLMRFFRIAPLYYLLLLVSYLALPQLGQMHDDIRNAFPPLWAQGLGDYVSKIGWNFDTWRWLYLHASFAFGLVPGMEASTPLPDWSLSVEMQFYLILPVLLLSLTRLPILILPSIAAILAILSPDFLGAYLIPGSWAHFGQPSVLSYRLNAFVAGMLLAVWLRKRRDGQCSTSTTVFIIIGIGICLLPLSKPVIMIYFVFAALVLQKVSPIADLLGYRPFKLIGDISYSIYLSHTLVVIPVVYWLIQYPAMMDLNAPQRFGVAIVFTAPIVFVCSYVLYRLVEYPGIRWGKALANKSNAV